MITGTSNVIAALPSGLVGPWSNAANTLNLVRSLTVPRHALPSLPGASQSVRVGSPVEERAGFVWQSWEDWLHKLPELAA